MAFFQPVNVMGPAHRGATIQMLAQNAAKSLAMRQRLRGIIHQGAPDSVAGGAVGGAGSPTSMIHGSFQGHSVGERGGVQRPALTMQQLQDMISRASGKFGSGPDGRFGGMTNPGGGGFDFGSIPDPGDPHQSPASIGSAPLQPVPAAGTPAPNPSFTANGSGGYTYSGPPAASLSPGQAYPSPSGSGTSFAPTPGMDAPAPSGNVGTTLIPLGNGMYYDPVADAIRGIGQSDSAGLSTVDKKF